MPRSKTQNGMLQWSMDIMKISIAAHITSQSNKRSSKVRLHGNILPDDNDDKVKDVVSVRNYFQVRANSFKTASTPNIMAKMRLLICNTWIISSGCRKRRWEETKQEEEKQDREIQMERGDNRRSKRT